MHTPRVYFIYILYMYNVHVLHVISPVEVIYMNYEIYESTPFDRQSTVNKQIKRWCKRTRQKCRGQGGMYMGVFTSKCLIFSSSVTLSPSVLIYIHLTIPEQFAAIFFILPVSEPPITRSIHWRGSTGLLTYKNDSSWPASE